MNYLEQMVLPQDPYFGTTLINSFSKLGVTNFDNSRDKSANKIQSWWDKIKNKLKKNQKEKDQKAENQKAENQKEDQKADQEKTQSNNGENQEGGGIKEKLTKAKLFLEEKAVKIQKWVRRSLVSTPLKKLLYEIRSVLKLPPIWVNMMLDKLSLKGVRNLQQFSTLQDENSCLYNLK